jgi:isoaspartyl peptidase/L-asparaginase-like protein (Ntn-hydrolase superfamily)
MDTSNFVTQQGAVNSANLSQTKSHVEVKEQTSTVVSSDEEKLAAGVSTTGLQTKRLSGAQRKKLMKAKKMEGTWTERKPP